ncbi:MAG: efflux RND transporter periplasmic adaptor subunit [Cypionkella sp.]|nr:efflux RND transporter periplasmic adaptor subunit [Cypionkella sp.]
MLLRSVLAVMLFAAMPSFAEDLVLKPVQVIETKALFGQIESRSVVPARARVGGTLVALDVTEGSGVKAGQVIARVLDEKMALQLDAAEARIRAGESELANAQSELKRNEELLARGATTTQRVDQIRTTVDVATNGVTEARAARAVIEQQISEGDVVAPMTGRVLTVPMRLGEVVMPGEPVSTIAGGPVFLRLAIPERHAQGLTEGMVVQIGDETAPREGKIEKIYPLIEGGRVTADVAVEGLSDAFIGQRILVQVPVGERAALVVPEAAIHRQAGLDLVRITTAEGARDVTVVPGPLVTTEAGAMREILSGLIAGDTVVLP